MPKYRSHHKAETLLPVSEVSNYDSLPKGKKFYKVTSEFLRPIYGDYYRYHLGLNNDQRTTKKEPPLLCSRGLHFVIGQYLKNRHNPGERVFEVKPGGRVVVDCRKMAADQLFFVRELTKKQIRNIKSKHRVKQAGNEN